MPETDALQDEVCIGGIAGCKFWFKTSDFSYAKSDEILTRHLRLHQIMETRRLAEATEGVLRALSGTPERPKRAVEPVHAAPVNGVGLTESVNGRCIRCGFPVLSRFHLDGCEQQEVRA